MASFGEQLLAAKKAHLAAIALEESVRQQIKETFNAWDSGEYTAQSVRWRLEAIVRAAYRTSAAVATAHVVDASGLQGWTPPEVFTTPYLTTLIADIRRNLREFKASDRGDVARRRAILRMQHGAGVAAQRGYTDAMVGGFGELADFGFRLRKVWIANFTNNDPCEHCRALHGQEVSLHEEFPADPELKVFGDLLGPPRHPRCQCYLAILLVSLENALEALDIEDPTPAPQTMSTEDVRNMPGKIFTAVVKTLQRVVSFFRGGHNG